MGSAASPGFPGPSKTLLPPHPLQTLSRSHRMCCSPWARAPVGFILHQTELVWGSRSELLCHGTNREGWQGLVLNPLTFESWGLHPTAPRQSRSWAGQPLSSPDPIVYLHSVFPAGERAAGGGVRSRAPENTSAPRGTSAPWGQGHRACQEVTAAMAEPGWISGYLFSTGSLLRRKVVQLKR